MLSVYYSKKSYTYKDGESTSWLLKASEQCDFFLVFNQKITEPAKTTHRDPSILAEWIF